MLDPLDVLVAFGGARPDERIGSEDPVRREAAVAAAATLRGNKENVNRFISVSSINQCDIPEQCPEHIDAAG